MFFEAPNHKANSFDIQIKGNFRDSKDSFYSINDKDFVHITFIKREDKSIWEEVRPLMILDSIDEFFPNEEPDIVEVASMCVSDGTVDLSTNWVCNGMDAEDVADDDAITKRRRIQRQ